MITRYNNKAKVAVLLSTYNGNKYVSQLIDSIMKQSFDDFTLYIRDDCSSDNTLSILNNYRDQYPNKIVIIPSERNIGSKKNFLAMVEDIASDYYMFADQDDVWMPNKIEISYRKITEIQQSRNIPIIVHTDLRVVDTNLNLIAESYWGTVDLLVDRPYKYAEFCHYNNITGCAMIFNRKLRDMSINELDISLPYYMHHDHYLGMLALKYGGLIFPLHLTTINFRRHDGNQTQPLLHRNSIFHKPTKVLSYIRDHYYRYKFFNSINPLTLMSYTIAKFKVTKYKLCKKKRV